MKKDIPMRLKNNASSSGVIGGARRSGQKGGVKGGKQQQQCGAEMDALFQCWKSHSVDSASCALLAQSLQRCLNTVQSTPAVDNERLNAYLHKVFLKTGPLP
ncbi:hypothetical protein MP228_004134 [Amoeboaphelidium protococcarum]|nr:hypothetical protein MP228_004134 [Amoeboaphelidium protococcarum]